MNAGSRSVSDTQHPPPDTGPSSGVSGDYALSLYDYDLPREMIAQRPATPRDSAKLMVLDRGTDAVAHRVFREVGEYLRAGDVLVLNNTKVLPARTFGARHTTGKVEVLFLEDLGEGKCRAMVRCGGRPRAGEFIALEGARLRVRLLEDRGHGEWIVSLPRNTDLRAALEAVGRMPLPPYIKRDPDAPPDPADRERYQTVYARAEGAVAAPTAGLHFTPELLESLRAGGVKTVEITLHVGPGTFLPVKARDIREHRMHAERVVIGEEAARTMAEARARGGRIVAVGTTACRSLEAAAGRPNGFGPMDGWTDLYITPPWRFRMTDVLLTNFHLPRSTLLMLVSAFAGRGRILAAYEEAKRRGYRFYSYGDAMLII